ncbi:MogA/MoaB family molybdenum cofactor biosynthesis protein [Polyangium sp. 15x6]|uniref:MogA/MoaB family molybdenum cofactor biosynthesis protein n=1 Tax=Polyangium sp. 15x6 TaxID=3042687 RepID=UPI00249AB1E9|nr:MogA/MoaB family molybdenum cofactor biosynthesis protein [Polyangium sp. 15x6]MDI3283952.1 MogA/MoaB family molybdenum cofactor biosynthesis protein [Polyangium sp. 15x6]
MSTNEKPEVFKVATFTLSDTRTPSDDVGGRVLVDRLRAAGFTVVSHAILREEPDELREAIHYVCDADAADAIVLTGGTGIAPRDRTIEVIAPMLDKTIDGFGEAFRRLSWDQIGPRAILSRAIAGVVRGKVIAALPGSPSAVELAVDALLAPTLAHAIALASGRGGKHAAHGHAHGKHGRKH